MHPAEKQIRDTKHAMRYNINVQVAGRGGRNALVVARCNSFWGKNRRKTIAGSEGSSVGGEKATEIIREKTVGIQKLRRYIKNSNDAHTAPATNNNNNNTNNVGIRSDYLFLFCHFSAPDA